MHIRLLLTASAVAVLAAPIARASTDLDPAYDPSTVKRLPKAALVAEPFSLRDVRLLDGPFKQAQELDRKYLLSLEPVRLLYNFRTNAGLPNPSGVKPYGGWEAPDCELRGHFVGHYLSACAMMAAATGDATLQRNAEYVAAELAKCQQALGSSGYLSAYPESYIDRVETRRPVWAPWYTLHKLYAGLIDLYDYCGDRQALETAQGMARWAKQRTDRLDEPRMQAMLETEHGGMNEAMANLYALTGNRVDLALAERFYHRAVLDPLAAGRDDLTGLHANTQIPKIIGCARLYELTGDPKYHDIASFFWNDVTRDRSYVIGGNSDGEHFSPKERLSHFLGDTTCETCNTYNMLKLTRHLFEWTGDGSYADYYERALYNHILASQDPDSGMMCYYVPLRAGARRTYNTPEASFWCCTGTGIENHAKYGDSIYFRGAGHGPRTLYVNLFIPSVLTWHEAGITVRQETRFPDAPSTRLTLTCSRPTRLTLRIRRPAWCGDGYSVSVNGHSVDATSAPGSYAIVDRPWKTGDVVEVSLPMTVHTEGFRDDPHKVALLDGPIVLCAPGRAGARPAIVGGGDPPAEIHAEAAAPLTFTAPASMFRVDEAPSASTTVTLAPFFRAAHERYVVYWDELTPAQQAQREAERQAEEARLRDLDARTVDRYQPGEEREDNGHEFAGERSATGDFGGHRWRDARDGGWFAFDMRLPDGAGPVDLVCTYWGSDAGGREWDILVGGKVLATERLENDRPGRFVDRIYELPETVTHGHQRVRIEFRAHTGRMAGGLFYARLVKRAP